MPLCLGRVLWRNRATIQDAPGYIGLAHYRYGLFPLPERLAPLDFMGVLYEGRAGKRTIIRSFPSRPLFQFYSRDCFMFEVYFMLEKVRGSVGRRAPSTHG